MYKESYSKGIWLLFYKKQSKHHLPSLKAVWCYIRFTLKCKTSESFKGAFIWNFSEAISPFTVWRNETWICVSLKSEALPTCSVHGTAGTGPPPADGSGSCREPKLWSRWCLQDEAHGLHSCEECPVVSVPHCVYVVFQLTVASDKCC